MTEVVVAGIGQTDVGEHWQISLRELAFSAISDALKDAAGLQPQALYVGNMLAPSLSRQAHMGALVADFTGLTGIEAATIEAAGASGGAALRQGYLAVASGMVDVALVVGVEKFTDTIGPQVDEAITTTSDSDFEAVMGLTPTAQAAMLARRYMHEHDMPADGLAGFALTAHANAVDNPHAMFHKSINLEIYTSADVVSEPLNIYDIAPNADGAAAVILTRPELLPPHWPHARVMIAGSGAASDTLALHDRQDILYFDTAQLSAGRAIKQAGLTLDQVSFFEYHDAYSIYAALSLEAIGFAIKGYGWKLASSGSLNLNQQIPCATMGGMKARGFPGGAAGVYQAVEATLQLRGQAGKNQILQATYGLIQSLGGPASTAVAHVLSRMD